MLCVLGAWDFKPMTFVLSACRPHAILKARHTALLLARDLTGLCPDAAPSAKAKKEEAKKKKQELAKQRGLLLGKSAPWFDPGRFWA